MVTHGKPLFNQLFFVGHSLKIVYVERAHSKGTKYIIHKRSPVPFLIQG